MPEPPNEPGAPRRTPFSGVTPLREPRKAPPAAPAQAPAAPPREGDADARSRKLIRPSLSQHVAPRGGAGSARRRAMPPEQTGAERAQLAQWQAHGTPIAVTLEDGEVVRGTLEWHDRDSIRLRRRGEPAIVVMKDAARSMVEDGEASRVPARG